MLLDQDMVAVPRDAHLKRWFLVAGTVGVLMAVLLAVELRDDFFLSGVVVTLRPAALRG